jgi:penicillin-binding protein 1A
VFGVEFEPKPFVVADATNPEGAITAERPPTLKPAAALKLLDLADALEATLRTVGSGSEVAALAVTAAPAPAGNL